MRSNQKQQAIPGQGLEEKIKELSKEEVEKLFNNYEAKHSQARW